MMSQERVAAMDLPKELQELYKDDHDLVVLQEAYEEMETIYKGSLIAMGMIREAILDVKNTSEISLTIKPTYSTANYKAL